MKLRAATLALAAISLAATPALSRVAFDRANAPVEGESELAGGFGLIAALAAAAIVAGIVVVADDSETELPVSS